MSIARVKITALMIKSAFNGIRPATGFCKSHKFDQNVQIKIPRIRKCICRICIRRIPDCLRNPYRVPRVWGYLYLFPWVQCPMRHVLRVREGSQLVCLKCWRLCPVLSYLDYSCRLSKVCFATYDIKGFAISRILMIWWSRTILFENVEGLYIQGGW